MTAWGSPQLAMARRCGCVNRCSWVYASGKRLRLRAGADVQRLLVGDELDPSLDLLGGQYL